MIKIINKSINKIINIKDGTKIALYNKFLNKNHITGNHCIICGKEIYEGKSKLCGTCITKTDLAIKDQLSSGGKFVVGIGAVAILLIKCPDKIISLVKNFGKNAV